MLKTNTELHDMIQSVATKSLKILLKTKAEPEKVTLFLKQFIDLSTDFQVMILALCKDPEKLWQMQLGYLQDTIGLLQSNMEQWLTGTPIHTSDKRFANDAWINNPFFHLLSQHYLLASEHLNSLLAHLDYGDPHIAKRIQFFTRQYLEALSPDNFLHTNPQIIAETLQSHGANLLRGLNNLLTDLEAGAAHILIKMTDNEAFHIGENIAITKGQVIFRNELMELIEYKAQTKTVYTVPLLIIPAWINKYYILDLSQNNSLVKWLVQQGFRVFIISWVNPDARLAHKSIYDYLKEGPDKALQIIQKQCNTKHINTLGFCIGGTLLAMLLAYHKACNKNIICSATFLAAMIDFSDVGDMAVFINEQQVTQLEKEMDKKGFLDGRFMTSAFNALRSTDLVWSFFIKHYLRGQAPVPFDILYWNTDATNMPQKMHSQYLRWMYLNNDLIKPNKIKFKHTPIDISQIDVPSFFVATKKDHIAPWHTVYLGYQAVNGDKTFLLGQSGHIAGIINPPSNEKYGFNYNTNTAATADDWLNTATFQTGSWWPTWSMWLKKRSGRRIKALNLNPAYHSIMDAPGSYVLMKCDNVEIKDRTTRIPYEK